VAQGERMADSNLHPAAERLREARLYGILDLGYVAPDAIERTAEQMCAGGVDVLQLRAKGFDEHAIEEFAVRIQPIAAAARVPFLLNDHPHLVPSMGADGAHVGQDDLTVADARWRAGRALAGEVPPPIIGKSTHSIEQAVAAAEAGADYIGFGPLYVTATKPGRPAIGLQDIARVHDLVQIPIFCIGGINLRTLEAVIAAGAHRVVIVSDLLAASDIPAYCAEVKRRLPPMAR
jgi:thiamine-phosphate pyrophosphorylase